MVHESQVEMEIQIEGEGEVQNEGKTKIECEGALKGKTTGRAKDASETESPREGYTPHQTRTDRIPNGGADSDIGRSAGRYCARRLAIDPSSRIPVYRHPARSGLGTQRAI